MIKPELKIGEKKLNNLEDLRSLEIGNFVTINRCQDSNFPWFFYDLVEKNEGDDKVKSMVYGYEFIRRNIQRAGIINRPSRIIESCSFGASDVRFREGNIDSYPVIVLITPYSEEYDLRNKFLSELETN